MSRFLMHYLLDVQEELQLKPMDLNTSRSTGKTMAIRCLIVEKLHLKINHGMLMHMEAIYLKHIICNATLWSCV